MSHVSAIQMYIELNWTEHKLSFIANEIFVLTTLIKDNMKI